MRITTLSKSFLAIVSICFYFSNCGFLKGGSNGPQYPTYEIKGLYGGDIFFPSGIAIDASGKIWVTGLDGSLSELLNNGTTIAIYSVGSRLEGVAIDANGNVWGVDNSKDYEGNFDVIEISPPPYYTYCFGNNCIIPSGIYPVGSYPAGIAIDASGNVWVTNFTSVTELSPTGTTIGTYSEGLMTSLYGGIAIDASGNAWVCSPGSSITELSPTGTTIATYPSTGTSIATYSGGCFTLAIDPSGNIWATGSNTVTKLSPAGITIGVYTVGQNPAGIAIDASGNVWVTNNGSGTVTELNIDGKTIGTYRVGVDPRGIAIDGAGNVWVANSGDGTITKIPGIAKGPQYFPYTGPQFPGGGNY